MSGGEKKMSPKEMQMVQNLIERCLQLYMNQKEVVETLMTQAKIEPSFTELVWKKLEEENGEFFKAYYLRLMLKLQITEFNKLLGQQAQLMQQINPVGVAPMASSNSSYIPPMRQNSMCYVPDTPGQALNQQNMHEPLGTNLPDVFANGGSSVPPIMCSSMGMIPHGKRVDAGRNVLQAPSSNVSLIQGMNGEMRKSEAFYAGTSPHIFGADGTVLQRRVSIPDASVPSFNTAEDNLPALNEQLLDAEAPSFGYLAQIPQDFSFHDLTVDLAHSSDLLENYPRSPFVDTDNTIFQDSHEREHQGGDEKLDNVAEDVSYGELGSASVLPG